MGKIGLGEVEPVDKSFTRATARLVFFEYIKEDEKASEVLRDLASRPLNSFVDAGMSPVGLWPIYDFEVRLHGRKLYLLRRFLTDWAIKWHLNVDWVLDGACWTLYNWQHHPPREDELDWTYNGVSWFRLSDEAFKDVIPPFGLSHWRADNHMRASYERSAKEKIEKHINRDILLQSLKPKTRVDIITECMKQVSSYCEKVLNVYLLQRDSRGNPQWKLAEQREDFGRNIRWTIRFQILGKSFSEIAREANKAVSTVQ